MNKLYIILKYLKYIIQAKTRHSVHSPFVYRFIDDILHDKKEYSDYTIIEKEVQRLKKNRNVLEIVDFGAGKTSGKYRTYFRRVSEIASISGITRKHGRLLYRLVRHYKPTTLLEMGTSLGISSMYQAKGNPEALFISVDGCASLAMIARNTLDNASCENVELKTGQFRTILPSLLDDMNKTVDYAFIDGDHTHEGTLFYFGLLKKHLNNSSILVFHDIYWSKEMAKAWDEIKKDPEVTVTIDLFFMGIVFVRKELSKQDFILRF
jgi:predicted O-methyltransferase YrrM